MIITGVCATKELLLNFQMPRGLDNYYHMIDDVTVAKRGTFERVKAVAELRNKAIKQALVQYPDTTDVLMVDSYYLHQTKALSKLIENYKTCKVSHIRGGGIWFRSYTDFFPFVKYYDTWAVPSLKQTHNRYRFRPLSGTMEVDCVGGVYLFPLSIWSLRHYSVPFPLRCEHYSIMRMLNMPIVLDLDCRFWRTPGDGSDIPYYPLFKRFRVTIGRVRRRIFN